MSDHVTDPVSTARLVDTDPENPPEITHLAVIQNYGLCVDNAVTSRGFPGYVEAIRWIREQVEDAHGELAFVWPTVCPFRYDLGGQPTRFQCAIWWIMTPGGPTNGFVIEINGTTEITKANEENN